MFWSFCLLLILNENFFETLSHESIARKYVCDLHIFVQFQFELVRVNTLVFTIPKKKNSLTDLNKRVQQNPVDSFQLLVREIFWRFFYSNFPVSKTCDKKLHKRQFWWITLLFPKGSVKYHKKRLTFV